MSPKTTFGVRTAAAASRIARSVRTLAFELHYQIRQPSSWIAAAAFLLLGGAFSRVNLGGEGVSATSPFSVTLNLALLTLLSVFAVTVLAARTGFRDRESGMAELVDTTPAAGGRLRLHALLGLCGASLLVLTLALAGMAGAGALGGPSSSPSALGLGGYLTAFVLVGVPNILLVTAVLYLVAVASARPAAVYLGGIGLFLGYFGLSILAGSPLIAGSTAGAAGGSLAVGLADPMGIVPLLEGTRHWTAEQLNTRPAWLDPTLLANRAVWTAVTILCAAAATRLPQGEAVGSRPWTPGWWRRRDRASGGEAPAQPLRGIEGQYRSAPQVPRGWRHALAVTWSTARVQLASQLRGVPFLVVGLLWMALAVMGLVETVGDGPFDTPFLPTSALVVPALFSPFRIVGSLLLIFFASELAWQDRTAGVHPLVDASPTGGGARVVPVILTLATLSALLVGLLQVVGVGYQLAHGGRPDPGLYASLFYFLGLPWLLVGVFTVGVQTIVPERHAGMLASAVVVVASRPLAVNLLDVDLPLLPLSGPPEIGYSVFAGFEPYLGAYHWHTLYGVAACAVIAVVSAWIWRRGSDTSLVRRARYLLIPDLRWRRAAPAGAAGVLAFVATGSVIHVATADQGHLVSEGQESLRRAAYERRLASLAHLPLPSVDRLDLTLDLYPGDRRYELEGSYRLVNESDAPLDSVVVGWDRSVTTRRITLDGRLPTREYAAFNHFLFVPERPLEPGQVARLDLRMRVEQSSFGELDPDHFVLSGGSFLRLERFLPWLGYEPALELEDPELRREYGLKPRTGPTGPDPGVRGSRGRAPEAEFTLTVSTPEGQRVAGPGRLVDRWSAVGRSHVRFESRGPTARRFGISSAPYRRETTASDGRRIRVLHHPRHGENVPVVADAARRTVEELSALFGPPGAETLTVAEIPSYGSEGVEATAYPGVVFVREHGGFTGDFGAAPEGRPNDLWRRTAHELAHQWWGGRVDPDRTEPGAAVLTETLAEYSAALLVERRFGREAHRQLMRWEADRYLLYRGRLGGAEPSLLEATAESPHVARFRGPVVLNGIVQLLGRDELNALLGEYARRRAGLEAEPARAGELYERIRAAVPAHRRSLVDDWFRGTAVHDLAIRGASFRPRSSGGVEAILEVVLEKREAGDPGEDGAPGASEPIVVEVTSGEPSARSAGAARTERRTVELGPGVNRVRLLLDSVPARIELDPDVTRIDTNRKNNVWMSSEADLGARPAPTAR